MELCELFKVIAGYGFREAIKPDENGDLFVLQARDIIEGEPFVDVKGLVRVSQDIPGYTDRLQSGDVLIVARGMKEGSFRSTVFKATENNVIPSASLHVLRVTSNRMIPEFLSLYLNSHEGQTILKGLVTGSYIGALPRKALEKMNIPIPSMEKQKLLVGLSKNIRDQQKILERKGELKQNIINATFKSLTPK